MILYCFITHQKELDKVASRVTSMMTQHDAFNEFIIVAGGYAKSSFDEKNRILKLHCNDYYEGLPEKVYKMFLYIATHDNMFAKYSFFIKADEDVGLIKTFVLSDIQKLNFDYGGYVFKTEGKTEGDRNWHLGKCSKDSYFNTNPYKGKYVPFCSGGISYIISRKALQILYDSNDQNYLNEIYEDVYIAKILLKHGVKPFSIPIHYWTKHLDLPQEHLDGLPTRLTATKIYISNFKYKIYCKIKAALLLKN